LWKNEGGKTTTVETEAFIAGLGFSALEQDAEVTQIFCVKLTNASKKISLLVAAAIYVPNHWCSGKNSHSNILACQQ
jgi:hypothetical protein